MQRILGLMSGTSLDGVDAALVVTDGAERLEPIASAVTSYTTSERQALRRALDVANRAGTTPADLPEAEDIVTRTHIAAVKAACQHHGKPDLIGMHGQTVLHRPQDRLTRQIGNAQAVADAVGVPVIHDFRQADLQGGGQGAPLAPLFHVALAQAARRTPCAVVNIGGIANVTFVVPDGPHAFDCGPGNALLDDWVQRHSEHVCDLDGTISAPGRVDQRVLEQLLAHPYFARPGPKSLDRLDFSLDALEGLALADGAATLVAWTGATIAASRHLIPCQVDSWILTGGGRRNPSIVRAVQEAVGSVEVLSCDALGWDGDALEAQLFAWLAARSVAGLPLSVPGTTGVGAPTTGGVQVFPSR